MALGGGLAPGPSGTLLPHVPRWVGGSSRPRLLPAVRGLCLLPPPATESGVKCELIMHNNL